jgi:ectoine hydroxylase
MDAVIHGSSGAGSGNALNEAHLAFYEKNGYVVLPEYMPEMVDPLLDEINVLKDKLKDSEELYTEPDSNELRTIFKPFASSRLIDRFSRCRKILNIVEQLLGRDVYLMQSRVNIKPAFLGRSFPWHSDFETWHVEDGLPRMRAVTAWIMLTENNEYNGPLFVVPGSHMEYISCAGTTEEKNYEKSLKKQVAGVPLTQTIRRLLDTYGIDGIYGKPGTVVFHECNLLHGSPDNITGTPRSILMFVYNSVKNKPVAPFSGLPPRPHYLSNPDREPLQYSDL